MKTFNSNKDPDPISESTLIAELDEGEVINRYPFNPSTTVGQVSQGDSKTPKYMDGIEVVNTVELDSVRRMDTRHMHDSDNE